MDTYVAHVMMDIINQEDNDSVIFHLIMGGRANTHTC